MLELIELAGEQIPAEKAKALVLTAMRICLGAVEMGQWVITSNSC